MEDFTVEVTSIEVNPSGFKKVEIKFSADLIDLLAHIDSEDIINATDKDELLDAIGVDYVKEHFGLTEAE